MRRSIRRLTFVTDAPHFGGAERYILAMARAARRRSIEPHVYWLPGPGSRPDVFKGSHVRDLEVTIARPEAARSAGRMIRSFLDMRDQHQPDALVINASGRARFWMMPWLAQWSEIPSVWIHQMVDGRDHRRLQPSLLGGRIEGLHLWRIPQTLRHRLAATAASAVVALNGEDREILTRWRSAPRDKIRVIPHGVDTERFQFDPVGRALLRKSWGLGHDDETNPAPLVIGTAGRLVEGKGIELLIEAVARLRRKQIPVVLAIAGQGPCRETMVELTRREGVTDAVRFVGFVQDMTAFYSALDVFALCSATESFGLALAEAMACGRPVVGTPTAGASRQIEHEVNGWQLESFEVGELARALRQLNDDRSALEAYGRQGREDVARQFSIDLTLERTLRALRGTAGTKSLLHWPGMDEPPFAAMAAEDNG